MEITRNQPQSVGTKHKTPKSATTASATPVTTGGLSGKTPSDLGVSSIYDVALSPKAANLQKQQAKAYELAKNTSPIREDKVQALKNKISAGEYAPDSNQIVEGIVREAVRDQLASEPYPV
jgi:flagellar biosynthesis anti-sigma factor FlgM